MAESPPPGKAHRRPDSSVLLVSALGIILVAAVAFALLTADFGSPLEGGGWTYQWAADIEYSEEVNVTLVSAALDEKGITDYGIDFMEDSWTSDRLVGDDIPGISRIWNICFCYNITVDAAEYGITNETITLLNLTRNVQNGTVELPIYAEIYNNHYDDGFSPELNMYSAHIYSPWSNYGPVFDGIDWKKVIEDEMQNYIQLIRDATGLEPESAEVRKFYS